MVAKPFGTVPILGQIPLNHRPPQNAQKLISFAQEVALNQYGAFTCMPTCMCYANVGITYEYQLSV